MRPCPLPEEFARPLRQASGRLGGFAERVLWFADVGSTNDVALSMADAGAAEGSVVVADAQANGRGRHGRSWSSPPGGGIYASVILRPRGSAPHLLTLAAGVAIAEGIQASTGLVAALKWPNDVYVPGPPGLGRKVAGILTEGSTVSGAIQHVVLGFGINVLPASHPPAVTSLATCIETELGRAVDRGLVLAECLAALWGRYVDLQADGGTDRVMAAWASRAAPTLGRPVAWGAGSREERGVAEGIDSTGALQVRTSSGVRRVVAGDVRWS